MDVSEAVATRRSIRAFTDKPVSLDVVREILDKARMAPSGCNYQPWEATILTGEPLRALQAKIAAAQAQDPIEYDFSQPNCSPVHLARLHGLAGNLYGGMDIARDDAAARDAFFAKNVVSFGAPVLLLCYFPRFMGPPQWSDVGMWLQTIMLLAREYGLDTCPQEFMALYARLIKDHIDIDDETHIFFTGLAIGYGDREAKANQFERPRAPLDEQVRFVGF